jgi:hypothetical protein
MSDIRALSAVIGDFSKGLPGTGSIRIEAILEAFHERGFGIILLFFAAPMALPVPVPPGINILLATPLLLLCLQMALGRHTIWLPQSIKNRHFDQKKLKSLLEKIVPLLEKIEFFIRPRLGFITQDGPSRLFGTLGVIMALTVCIPVPLTNTVPSLGIALMAIGVSMRDGLAVFLGAVIGTLWVAMLVFAILAFGPDAYEMIRQTIKGILP